MNATKNLYAWTKQSKELRPATWRGGVVWARNTLIFGEALLKHGL